MSLLRTDWLTTPLGRLVSINKRALAETTDPDYTFRYLDISSVGRGEIVEKPTTLQFENAPSRARRILHRGDTIVSTVRTYLRAVLPIRDDASDLIASTGFAVLSPGAGIDSRFLSWYAQSDPFIEEVVARSVGVSYPAIAPSELAQFPVPTPALAEQRAIADFLDAETARIDALIAKKRQLVERLNQRLSVEHERLVLGQDQVQESSANGSFYGATAWPETTLRHLDCEVQTGPFGSQLHADDYVKDGWPVVNPSNIVGGQIIALPEVSVNDETRIRLARHLLKPGDIVFGRRGEMGRAGLVREHEAGWLCGTGSLRLRLVGDRLLPEYLKLLLETGASRRYFQLSSVGSTMENLNTEILLAMPILVPPIGEQSRVVRIVSRSRAHNLELESKLNRSIDLLAEHRQALITAAVTGQLTVPGATVA